jgi:acetoin utilization protein AcuB
MSTVGDFMTRRVETLSDVDRLRKAVELVLVRRIRHVPVVTEGGLLAGIVTDRDMMRAMPTPLSPPSPEEYEELLDGTPIARVMTRDPITVEASEEVASAVYTMLDKKISGLPVLEGGALVGMFTQSDALRGYLALLGKEPPPPKKKTTTAD